jgi:glycosyltransferase involved in cell wall biosynthesis/peptidoglycan/xylan/chitin deacetylase (PgdA/CDA1 family)
VSSARGRLWPWMGRAAWWSGLGPVAGWMWRRRAASTWTVLGYHRVGTAAQDGGPGLVAPDRFRAQLRWLKARYDVVPVGEAFAAMRAGGRRRPMASLTFDDGYRDNVATALPILLEEGCHATLYPTLEAIEEGRAPWPHRLSRALARLAGSGRAVPASWPKGIAELAGAEPSAGGAGTRVAAIVSSAKRLPAAECARFCAEVEALAGTAAADREMLSAAELRDWAAAGMEVGSHTHRHPVLARQTPGERRADLLESRRGLERITGTPVVHLAYPNGRTGDWDDAVVADARACGYETAMTTIEGINRPGADALRLARISVGDDEVPAFALRLLPGVARRRARWHARRRAGRPIRVAFIGGRGLGSAYSGIERYYEEIGSRLAHNGCEVTAYCRPHFAPAEDLWRGIRVRRVPTIRSKHLETFVHTILSTADVCFRRVDLVQFHALGSSPFAWVPRMFGKRTVVSVRGLDWQRAKWGWLARFYLRFCESTSMGCPNATAVVSRTLQDHFQARFGRPVRYIPNGVVRTEPRPFRTLGRYGLEPRRYFLYAGRLSPEKGLHVAIEAHAPVDGVRLALAGGSSYSESYMRTLREQAGDGVAFTGFLTGEPLEEIYSNALAFLLPSRMEGLSVALLEAMAYGLPVIASDIPENRELVDECGGYLFRLDDVADLRRVLRSVAAAPEAAREVGLRARERVRARFDWDRIAVETAAFYREVMAGTGRAPVTRPAAAAAPAPAASPAPADPAPGLREREGT